MNIKNTAYFFVSAIAIVVVLIFGKSLLIPFVFALLLWFIIREFTLLLDKIPVVKKRFPKWTKNLITFVIILVVLGFVTKMLSSSITSLAKAYPAYEDNVSHIIQQINTTFDINLMELVKGRAGNFDFGVALRLIINALTEILSNTFLILIYVIFIFLEEAFFRQKLEKAFANSGQFSKVSGIIENIEKSVSKYLGLKTFVSLVTGVLSYIALLIIRIDAPVFWAFLIFILNFIPTIGSLVATLFPAAFCLLQFGEFTPALMVLVFVGLIQVAVGNILEPKLMGSSMNLSALVTILALSVWGAIWGITGMILSVPITVIMVIVFSQFPSSRPVAIMLSEKGEV